MARMFHALVVLGSGLAGCGGKASSDSDVMERQVTDERSNADDSGESDDSAASGDDSSTDDAMSADDTISPDDANDDDATAMDDVSAADDAAAATDDTNSADDAVIDVDPPVSSDLSPAPQGPDECPPAQWQCAVDGCQYERTPSCNEDWDETIQSCLLAPTEGCTCAAEPAPQPSDCGAEEVYTCAAGWFETPGDATAGKLVAFDCQCAPRGLNCSVACGAHTVGAYNRACVEDDDLVLCGACIWTGILR